MSLNSQENNVEIPFWLEVVADDLDGLDIEQPILGCNYTECHELSYLYHEASKAKQSQDGIAGAKAARAYSFLAAVLDMYFKPADRNEPFGPHMVMGDRRTAILSDFNDHVSLLSSVASSCHNPVLRARLSDVCSILDRKLGSLAIQAASAYVEIVQRIRDGSLYIRHLNGDAFLDHAVRDLLHRALYIGRSIGWDRKEIGEAKAQVSAARVRAITLCDISALIWSSDLDLDFRVSEPSVVGTDIERALEKEFSAVDHRTKTDLWRLAARAYQLGKDGIGRDRCKSAAAECLVAAADCIDRSPASAMMCSHLLMSAISELHGVSGQKERRLRLRHRLIDKQSEVLDGLSTISREVDLTDMVRELEQRLTTPGLFDKLFILATLSGSPDVNQLRLEALETLNRNPLSSLFEVTHLDYEGKIVHRTEGGGFASSNEDAITSQIAQSESIRRGLVVRGAIQVARQNIVDRHHVDEECLSSLLQHSPFIPPNQINTYARGFVRFFQGDFISATYILTPLLESSLRYLLKLSGHDVTILDNASQTQQDRTISSLFDQMRPSLESVISPEIVRELESVFLARPGPTVRHSIAHGLLQDGFLFGSDAIYCCWLMFRLSLLPILPDREVLRASFRGM